MTTRCSTALRNSLMCIQNTVQRVFRATQHGGQGGTSPCSPTAGGHGAPNPFWGTSPQSKSETGAAAPVENYEYLYYFGCTGEILVHLGCGSIRLNTAFSPWCALRFASNCSLRYTRFVALKVASSKP